jgi:hypothetical protein
LVKLQLYCFSSTLPSLTYIFVAEQITKEKKIQAREEES